MEVIRLKHDAIGYTCMQASVAAFKGVTAADLAGSGKKAFPPSSQGDKSQSAPKQEKAASSVQQAPRTSGALKR